MNPNSRSAVWSIAGPSIAVFMLSTISGLLIIRIVAGLGTPAVAAVTAGQRVNFVMVALLMGMGAATTALVSRAWGARDQALATAYTRLSLRVGLGLCLVLSVVAIAFAQPLARFFQLDALSHDLAVGYIRWLSLFGVTQGLVMVLSTALRATGDARTPLLIGAVAHVLGVLGAYGLAYGRWGLPVMGVNGAAIGWGLAFTVGGLSYLALWSRDRLRLPFSYGGAAPQTNLRQFLVVCTPATIEQVIMQFAMFAFIGIIATFGTPAFAAYGIGTALFSVALVIGLGFSIAASALVGQSLGAGNAEAAIENARYALRLAVGTMTFAGALCAFFAAELSQAMVEDPLVAELTRQFLLALSALQPLLAVDFVLGGAMRGAGHTGFPLIAGIVSIVGVRLPLAVLLANLGAPVGWVFSVFIADQLVKTTLIAHRYRSRRWLRPIGLAG